MFALLQQPRMPESPSPPSAGPQSGADTAAANAKLSGLDTLSLAATAALDERGVLTTHSSVIYKTSTAGTGSGASDTRRKLSDAGQNSYGSHNESNGSNGSNGSAGTKATRRQNAPKSTSPESDRSRLALLSNEAEVHANNTTTSGNGTGENSLSPSQPPLPNLSTLFSVPHQGQGNVSPISQSKSHSEHRWSYPNHSANLGTAVPDNSSAAIHPQLAAMSAAAVAAATESQLPGMQSLMSIANLTSPMYKPVLPKTDDSPTSGKRKFEGESPNGLPNSALPSNARKKRQCSECLGWFSNLATHKSTHLTETSRPHTCEICKRGFARPNDLFRHTKSHRGKAPFQCPYFVAPGSSPSHYNTNRLGDTTNDLLGLNGNGSGVSPVAEPACHQNGGFSRCDTYKNHLKAMHFEYPPGTKKKERAGMKGTCKGCGMEFMNSEMWITRHVEIGECPGIVKMKDEYVKGEYAE